MQHLINIQIASLLLFMPILGLAQPTYHAVCGVGTVSSFSENYQGTGKFTAKIQYSTPPSTGQSPAYIIINTSNPSANDLMSRSNILNAYLSRGFVHLSSNVQNNQSCQLIDSVAACRTQSACANLNPSR
jgi:hypothetical protein